MIKVIKKVLLAILLLFLLIVGIILAVRIYNSFHYAISGEGAVNTEEYIELNGQKQYIQIRGEDVNNPMILFLHGGPGSPHAYVSHYYQKDLEDQFTFVNWDQRGGGRTYFANEDKSPVDMSIIYKDLEVLVGKLLEKYGKEKLIIMGHSWGSIIGSKYAIEHPDKVERYVGIGQVWNISLGEELTTNEAIKMAKDQGNIDDVKSMEESIVKLTDDLKNKKLNLEEILKLRKLTLGKYLVSKNTTPFLKSIWLGLTSPMMNIDDVKWFFKNSDVAEYQRIFEKVFIESQEYNLIGATFEVPVTIIMGNEDWVTPYVLSEIKIESLKAPLKELILVDKAGHAPHFDNTEEFIKILKRLK